MDGRALIGSGPGLLCIGDKMSTIRGCKIREKEMQLLLFVCLVLWGAVGILAWLTLDWITEFIAGVL